MNDRLVIGSRGSALALRQANWAKHKLLEANAGLRVDIETIKTSGDIMNSVSLSVIGGKGVFTNELETSLLSGEIDVAVHSLKDLPTTLQAGLVIAAITEREEPRDALILRSNVRADTSSLTAIPADWVIGTSSLRRAAQLRHLLPKATVKDIRGNIDSRLFKLDRGEYDAVILAAAGLFRLGTADRISLLIESHEMLSAVGQGALAVEVRSEDNRTTRIVATLDDRLSRIECETERAFLRRLGGGCQMPIAAHASAENAQVRLDGLIIDVCGKNLVRGVLSARSEEPEELGARLAEDLLRRGGQSLLDQLSA